MKTKTYILLFILFSFTLVTAQDKKNNDKKMDETKSIKTINSTQATGDQINFKDATNHTLIRITDEGTVGSLSIPPGGSAPTVTANKLYNVGGTLFFGNTSLGSGGASSINDLSDAIFDGSSLFLGSGAGISDDGSNQNTAVGLNSLYSNTTGNANVGLGTSALYSNTAGADNIAIGFEALYSNTNGVNNTAIGRDALYNAMSTSENTAIGSYTLYSNTTGGANTVIGYEALYYNETGNNNTAIGFGALLDNTIGFSNTANGTHALQKNTEGYYNVGIGYSTNFYNQIGNRNTIIGYQAGYGTSGVSESGNVFLGYQAGYNETGSNLLYIENSNSSSPLIWGDFAANRVVINGNSGSGNAGYEFFVNGDAGGLTNWNSLSDIRLKENIKTIPDALDKVKSLRGINFEWKDKEKFGEGLQMGFVAQEVEKVIPEVVDTKGEYYTMQYAPVTALLVEAVKKLSKQNEELMNRIEKLEQRLDKEELSDAK